MSDVVTILRANRTLRGNISQVIDRDCARAKHLANDRCNKKPLCVRTERHLNSFRAGFDNRTMTEAGDAGNGVSRGGVPC